MAATPAQLVTPIHHVKQMNWTADMEFLLLGSVHGHKAHIKGNDAIWQQISRELDQHFIFNQGKERYLPLAGTAKARGKFNRLLENFKRKFGNEQSNISGLQGDFSREDELLFRIHSEKLANEEQRVHDKKLSAELQYKYKKQDLTHGLEAGRIDERTNEDE